jgi:hypothetical protein
MGYISADYPEGGRHGGGPVHIPLNCNVHRIGMLVTPPCTLGPGQHFVSVLSTDIMKVTNSIYAVGSS